MRHSVLLRGLAVLALAQGVATTASAQTEPDAAPPDEAAPADDGETVGEADADDAPADDEGAPSGEAVPAGDEGEAASDEARSTEAAAPPARRPVAPAEPPTPPAGGDEPWVRGVHDRASGSVVTIHCGWRRGTGFLFGSADRVAATHGWDRCTRAIHVHLPDGTSVDVDRGRVSWDDGVALIHLPRPSRTEPLSPSAAPVRVGDPIAALGHDHDVGAVVATGMVSARPGRSIRAQLEPPPGARGGPVLNADGEVVGVMTRRHGHMGDDVQIVPVARLEALADGGTDDTLGRTFSFGIGPFGALALDEDPAVSGDGVWLGGFGGALSATVADRLTLVGGFSVLRDASGLFDDGVVKRSVRRYQAEGRLGWRLLLSSRWPVYVVPALGASARWDRWTDRQLRIQLEDPACDLSDGSACELSTDVVREEEDDFSVTPYVHLSLRLGFLDVGYTLSLVVDDDTPGTFVHRFVVGAWLGS